MHSPVAIDPVESENQHLADLKAGIALELGGLHGIAAERRLLGGTKNVMARFGGPGRDRTDDLFHAMEARSQLRHRPTMGTLRALLCGGP